MGCLGLVVTATVGRQSREAVLGEKGCRAPHPLQELGQDRQPALGAVHSLGRPMAESV